MRFVSLLLVSFLSAPATAAVRTWVSTTGLDTAPCSRTEPCRSFGAAVSAVDPAGEVVVLESGGYGAVAVGKAVSLISPPGIHAAIAPTSGAAISIATTIADDIVVLRGLYLNSQGGTHGVLITNAGAVHVENLVINGFTQRGILTQSAPLLVIDTIVRNGGPTSIGIEVGRPATGATIPATIDRVHTDGNETGVRVGNHGRVVIRDSVAANNSGFGYRAEAFLAPLSEMTIESCLVRGTGTGIGIQASSGISPPENTVVSVSNTTVTDTATAVRVPFTFPLSPATIRVSDCTITGNALGLENSPGGVLETRSNNTVSGNTTNTSGTITNFGAN